MEKTCILIPTCSIYKNIWEPYLILLRKFWKECKFEIFIGCDSISDQYYLQKKYNIHFIESNIIAKGNNILIRLAFYLEYIKNNGYINFFLLVDDYFPVRDINNNDMLECLKLISFDKKIGTIRFYPSKRMNKNKKFYKTIKYHGISNIKTGIKYRDNICPHCLDKLYIPPPNLYLPHIETGLDDPRILKVHTKENKLNLHIITSCATGPAIWNTNLMIKYVNNLINPDENLKICIQNNNNVDINIKDWRLFELMGSQFFRKSNKLVLIPYNPNNILYPARAFCGGGIIRGVVLKWVRELMNIHKINLLLDKKNCIFNSIKYNSDYKNYSNKLGKYPELI